MDSSKIHMFWVSTLLLCGGIQHVRGRPQPSAQDEPQPIPGPDGSIPGGEESGGIDSIIESHKKDGRVAKLTGKFWVTLDGLQSSGLWLIGENGLATWSQLIFGPDGSEGKNTEIEKDAKVLLSSLRPILDYDGDHDLLSPVEWLIGKIEGESQPIPGPDGSIPGEEGSGGIDSVIESLKKDGRVAKLMGEYWVILDDVQSSELWLIEQNGLATWSQPISGLDASEGKDTEIEKVAKALLSSLQLIFDDVDDGDHGLLSPVVWLIGRIDKVGSYWSLG